MENKKKYDVIIIGAGPIGLATAVHLLKQNISTILFERSPDVGGNIAQWGHVQLFTPWNYNLNELCAIELKKTGWKYPNFNVYPTGDEFLSEYLKPLSQLPLIRSSIKLGAHVTRITKENERFIVQINGAEETYECKYLLDCSGTFLTPNKVLTNEKFESSISYKIPDLSKDANFYKNKRIAVIGTGHSAMQTVLELLRLKKNEKHTQVYWLSRSYNELEVFKKERRYFKDLRNQDIGEALDLLEQNVSEGEVKFIHPFNVDNLSFDLNLQSWCLDYPRIKESIFDIIIVNCGFKPEYQFYQRMNLSLHPEWECVDTLFHIIDPSKNSCLTVKPQQYQDLLQKELNLFVLGQKSYGRAPSFLLKTGYSQIDSVVSSIAGNVNTYEIKEPII